jgi:hypothetical protein
MPSTKVAAAPTISTMKRKSIFRNNSQKLDTAFIEAGLPGKVLLALFALKGNDAQIIRCGCRGGCHTHRLLR